MTNFTKNAFGPILSLDNQFDEKFLDEKESALSPMILDDCIQIQNNNNTNNLKKDKKNINNGLKEKPKYRFSTDKRKSKKSSIAGSYGSNIIIISSYKDEDDRNPITEEVNKLINISKNLRAKKPIKKSKYEK